MLAMMRPFMKKELLNMIHIHRSLDTFMDVCVPRSMMPTEFGGTAGKKYDMIEKTYNEIKANGEYFIEEEATKRVQEKLRPGKPKTERDIFGYFSTLFSGSKSSTSKVD